MLVSKFNSFYKHYLLILNLAFFCFSKIPLSIANSEKSHTPECESKLLPVYSQDGHFTQATVEAQSALGKLWVEKGGTTVPIDPSLRIADADSLFADLSNLSKLAQARSSGIRAISKHYIFTSAAGLWNRGGSLVKALIPFNIGEVVGNDNLEFLEFAHKIFKASSNEEILNLYQARNTQDQQRLTADRIIAITRNHIESIISSEEALRVGINPIDLKFINVALWSYLSNSYVPFDIWTSAQTHNKVKTYINWLRLNFKQKIFSKNFQLNSTIINLLEMYFSKSTELGETHLFGYQVGFHALHFSTGEALTYTTPIGEGAGMAKHYLDHSGRSEVLKSRGIETWSFENIEAHPEIPILLNAYLESNKTIGVVLVPEKAGYAGGHPFVDSEGNIRLREDSTVPVEQRKGHKFFNSNTIFHPFNLSGPQSLGFETKRDPHPDNSTGLKVQVKLNAGDYTLSHNSAGIGGRLGIDYEDFKTINTILNLGPTYLENQLANWAAQLTNYP